MKNSFKPLSDKELDWLDNFLLERIDEDADTRNKDAGVLDVSELDGLFTAIVSGPEMIQPSQWLPQVWGDFEPEWNKEEGFETVLSLMIRHMNGIAATLMEQPQNFEPMFLERIVDDKTCTIVDEWCEGFMRGVLLASEEMLAALNRNISPAGQIDRSGNIWAGSLHWRGAGCVGVMAVWAERGMEGS